MKPRIIKLDNRTWNERGGYAYRRLISEKEHPYNVLHIKVVGTHGSRRVVHGIRNYYVVGGEGSFTIEGEVIPVAYGMLLVIYPGEVYSYTGSLELLEMNVPTDGKIAHEDLA